jgi:hypothetical protein
MEEIKYIKNYRIIEEFRRFYSAPNIIGMIKTRRINGYGM